MLSSLSNENFDLDDPASLMLTVITQTSNGLKEILERVHNTRQKMETSSQEDSHWGNSQLNSWRMLKMRGLRSSLAKVEQNFLRLLKTCVLGISLPNSDRCMPMLSGDGPRSVWATNVPPGSNLQMELFLSWLATERSFWNYEVSHARHYGGPSCSLRSRGLTATVGSTYVRGRRYTLRLGVTANILSSWKSKDASPLWADSNGENYLGAIARQPHLHEGALQRQGGLPL